jgi:hypothetical protein
MKGAPLLLNKIENKKGPTGLGVLGNDGVGGASALTGLQKTTSILLQIRLVTV